MRIYLTRETFLSHKFLQLKCMQEVFFKFTNITQFDGTLSACQVSFCVIIYANATNDFFLRQD